MIEAIIKSLDSVFSGQDWVVQYGGLAETWSRKATGEGGVEFDEFFPVVWGTNPERCGDGCQSFLMPDAGKKNVLFWVPTSDAVSGAVPNNYSRANKPVQITQTARLIVWLNFTGCQSCDQTSFMAYVEHLRQLFNDRKFNLSDPIKLKGSMKVSSIPTRDFREVFGQWHFGRDQLLFVYPFDFFGLDVTFTWIQNQSCPPIPSC